MQVSSLPGSTTLVTRIDSKGNKTQELVSTPESTDQIAAKQKFLSSGEKYKLTVTSSADRTGDNAVPSSIYVMKDTYMFWRVEKEQTGSFELPAGTYDIQVIYDDYYHSIVNFPNVELSGEKEISVNADMADKIVYFDIVMPDGSPMTLPLRDDPSFVANTSQIACHQVVMVNGASQFFQSITTGNGGNKAYTNFAVKSNFDENTTVIWNALTWKTDFGNIGVSKYKDGKDLVKGEKVRNDVSDYYKIDAKFQRTPLYYDKGADNTVMQMGINLYRPDNSVLSGFALSITDPTDFYICAPDINSSAYYTLSNLQAMEVYPKYGRKLGIYTPSIGMTDSGVQYLCNQYENTLFNHGGVADSPETSREGAPFNPYFSYPFDPLYVMASTTPYATVGAKIQKSNDITYNSFSVGGYYGNYGENRFVDTQYFTEGAICNGDTVDLSKYRDTNAWLQARAEEFPSSKDAVSIKYTNTNILIDDIEGKSECEFSFIENSEDAYPPTVQRIMWRDGEGVPTVKFDTNQDAFISVAGGDFKPEVYNCDFGSYTEDITSYEYSPATLKVEIAPYGTNEFVEIPMTEDKDKYVESYGAYWEGSLSDMESESENHWYDLKVTMTDEAGNTQVQTLTPAVYIGKITSGIKSIESLTTRFDVVDGSIVSSDNTEFSVFNLAGMRVSNTNLPKGVYIVNGKNVNTKVLVK